MLECSEGVRLLALHDRVSPRVRAVRGVVVLMHGWEGSATSTYLETLRPGLLRDGWVVYRLNFRDHGPTHALNRGLFHSCRLIEVVDAVARIAGRENGLPLALVGYSLGGNFALRVGLHAPARGIPIDRIIAINPVLEPANVLTAIESGPRLFERHFVRKWRRSIRNKRRAFPGLYDFDGWMQLGSLREQTRRLVEHYTEFDSLDDYLDGYSIGRHRLRSLTIPSTLVTTGDDPIIPIADLEALDVPPCLTIEIERWGGHCGYVEDLRLRAWIDRHVRALLRS